jgi:hypothetical protein
MKNGGVKFEAALSFTLCSFWDAKSFEDVEIT